MKRAVWTASLVVLLARPAFGQCTAFVAPPTARITIDEFGNNVWQKERTDYVIAYPARSFTASQGLLIKAGAFDMTFSGCTLSDFSVSKKQGLTKLWVQKGGDFEAVWAKTDALAPVSYSPALGSTGSISARASLAAQNLAAIDHAAALVIDRLKSVGFKPPEIENQHTFSASFDKVWAALVETLSDQKWQIESIDKSSGLVTTKAAVDSDGGTMACATKLDEAHRTWLNVFVKATETGARVKVNASFKAMREDQAITCYSSGALEKSLFAGVEKNLTP